MSYIPDTCLEQPVCTKAHKYNMTQMYEIVHFSLCVQINNLKWRLMRIFGAILLYINGSLSNIPEMLAAFCFLGSKSSTAP